jgi:putative glutathione S-transferase
MMTRAIKGLENVISFTVVMPIWQRTRPDDPDDMHAGWHFANPDGMPLRNAIGLGGPFPTYYPGNDPDPHLGAKSVRELYELAGQVGGKFTVPILFDKKSRTIVSNESSDIIRMMNSEFDDLATSPNIDLRPDDMMSNMDEVDEWIYPTINNGVYR